MNTPPLFHVGQLVTPVENCDWNPCPGAEDVPSPQLGKVYEVAKLKQAHWGRWFLGLVEIAGGAMYRDDCFVAVEGASTEAIAALLSDSLTPVLV